MIRRILVDCVRTRGPLIGFMLCLATAAFSLWMVWLIVDWAAR
jgi:hypothetical protein